MSSIETKHVNDPHQITIIRLLPCRVYATVGKLNVSINIPIHEIISERVPCSPPQLSGSLSKALISLLWFRLGSACATCPKKSRLLRRTSKETQKPPL